MITNRLLKALILCPILLLLAHVSQAQKTVSGKILDEKGNPVVGASVVVKGGKAGTTTDATGHFSFVAPAGTTTVVVSYVGYDATELDVTSSGDVTTSLKPSTSNLNDIVVVGYGTARRKDLTGALATVKEKDFNKGVITAPDQLIQGKVAGVMVINNMGQPGGSTTIRIRGTSSIRSGNAPLVVVDGIPLSGGFSRPGATGGDYGSDPGNPLNFINPNDIASMDVLKDASATAIYGSRGANGVIIITTKRGQQGIPQLDLTASAGLSDVLKKPEVLNGDEYRQALKDYNLTSGDYGKSVDAWDAITRTALTQNYNAAVSGGNDNGRYRVSTGYLDQQGVIETSEFKKYSAALNTSFKFLDSKKLGLDINLLVSQTNEDIAPVSSFVGFTGNVIAQALQWNPTYQLTNPDGSPSLYPVGGTTINPLASLQYYKDKAVVNTVLASISPSYKITKNLEYKFLYSVLVQTGERRGMVDSALNIAGIQHRGTAFINYDEQTNSQITNTLSYNSQITSSLNLNAVVGHEWLIFDERNNGMSAYDFTDIGLNYYDFIQYSTQANRSIYSYANPINQLQSFFGRAIVNWKDRFVVTGTLRADGSTKFGANNKYGYFPSVGAAWNLANEKFISGGIINNLKLRAGWGQVGNQEFPSGASQARFVINQQSIPQTNFADSSLQWENSTTINLGVDFGLFRNRLFGSVDYFDKKTEHPLFEQTLAQPGPNGKIWVNLPGNITNKGVEVTLTGVVIQQKDLTWNVSANATFLTNDVEGLKGYVETGQLRGQGFSNVNGQRVTNGQPLDVWYLAHWEGIDKSTGQSIYTGGDPAANKFYAGSPNPTTLLGFSTDVNWRKFSLVVNMNGAFGNYIFNNTAATVLGIGNLGNRNVAKSVINTGVQEAISDAPAPSDRFLEKGDYMKLTNATLSYHVGNLGKAFKNVNISLTGQNLFIITNYSGFDPEINTDGSLDGVPSLGIEYIPYPPARTVMLGVSFSL